MVQPLGCDRQYSLTFVHCPIVRLLSFGSVAAGHAVHADHFDQDCRAPVDLGGLTNGSPAAGAVLTRLGVESTLKK